MRRIRKGDFAKLMEVSAARVSQWIRDGILVRSVLPDGTLDLDTARREVGDNRDPLKVQDYQLRYDVVDRPSKKRKDVLPKIDLDFSSLRGSQKPRRRQ